MLGASQRVSWFPMIFPRYWLAIAMIVLGLARQITAASAGAQDLAQFYTPPQLPEESNHYIDMWGGPALRELALAAGLTNNHALLVNSHGKAMRTARGWEYVWYPRLKQGNETESSLYFSAADLAALLGPAASEIHNIVLSGCNKEKAFSAAALRKYFVNATNIIHAPAGQLGYQPMFFQALFNLSTEIRPLYETSRANKRGEVEYQVDYTPKGKSVLLRPYIAELFEPGKAEPYRIQIAGRELLAP